MCCWTAACSVAIYESRLIQSAICRSESMLGVVFFTQKTAYEGRISDWSSDVCSSDLRWFALQKLWMSAQGKRNPLKRGKDQIQDTALLDAVRERMPQFPLDHAFENGLPEELRGFYEGWMETVGSVASGTADRKSTRLNSSH